MTQSSSVSAAPPVPPAGSRTALQRRVLVVVMVAQLFGGVGLASGVTVGSLLAKDMLGSTGLAGLPVALFVAGSAAAAVVIGRVSQARGRRPGLALGYAAGAVGGAGVAVAAVADSVWLLLVTLAIYGSGTAANLQARYAGADLAEPHRRGRAISMVLVATTAGAVAGPSLVGVSGDAAAAAEMPTLSGPFVLAAGAYGLAALVLAIFLRPDPLLTAASLAAGGEGVAEAGGPTETDRRTVSVAATAMVLTQLAMVAIMTMTPLHLTAHGHGLDEVGFVIAVHIAGMYLASPVTGWLVDRYGRRPVLAAGGIVLVLAGLLGALADPDSVALLALALGLLGLGWNLGLIAGTALVTDATSLTDRARTQGGVDLTIALSGAAGGLASGGVVAAGSFTLLAAIGGAAGLLILPMLAAGASQPASSSSSRS